jgi:ferric-dicitrate binding protein FerR (iron transport regulator)
MIELRLKVAEPVWDDARARANFVELTRRRRSRRWMRGAAVVLLLGAFWLRPRPERVRFGDGSVAEILERGSVVSEAPAPPGLVVARLQSGRARFDVVHDDRRRFRVEAGAVAVEVLGTQFTVEKSGDRARVMVERGRVRVSWRGGGVELGVGERGLYPPPDEVADLLREADAARREGRPEAALAPLHRVVDGHADDPRAPLAAFTLGRLYFDELHRAGDAAAAFARARSLDPDGPLAADARAREAQARGAR